MKKIIFIASASLLLSVGIYNTSYAILNTNISEQTATQESFNTQWQTIKTHLASNASNGKITSTYGKAYLNQLVELMDEYYGVLKAHLASNPQLENDLMPKIMQRGTLAGKLNQLAHQEQIDISEVENIIDSFLETF